MSRVGQIQSASGEEKLAVNLPLEIFREAKKCPACGMDIQAVSTQITMAWVPDTSSSRQSRDGPVLYHAHCLQRQLLVDGIVQVETFLKEASSSSLSSSSASSCSSSASAGNRSKEAGVSSQNKSVAYQQVAGGSSSSTGKQGSRKGIIRDGALEVPSSKDQVKLAFFTRMRAQEGKMPSASEACGDKKTLDPGVGLKMNLLGNATLSENRQLLPGERKKLEKNRRDEKAKQLNSDPLWETHAPFYSYVGQMWATQFVGGREVLRRHQGRETGSSSSDGDIIDLTSDADGAAQRVRSPTTFVASCCSRPVSSTDAMALPCEGCWNFFHLYCVGVGDRLDLQPSESGDFASQVELERLLAVTTVADVTAAATSSGVVLEDEEGKHKQGQGKQKTGGAKARKATTNTLSSTLTKASSARAASFDSVLQTVAKVFEEHVSRTTREDSGGGVLKDLFALPPVSTVGTASVSGSNTIFPSSTMNGGLRSRFLCEPCGRARKKRRHVEELPPAFQKVSQVAAFTPTVDLPEVSNHLPALGQMNYLARFAAKRRKAQIPAAANSSSSNDENGRDQAGTSSREEGQSQMMNNASETNKFVLNPVYETDFLGGGGAKASRDDT
ncbi:unnamed protein product [Amoebophrya sp. A25]|nr:unnamed protein product [Amoebophrya sp. A25]|eukprot:GSA25T00005847001.1